MASNRRFTRPRGKKLTGVAKKHPLVATPTDTNGYGDTGSSSATPVASRRILLVDRDAEAAADTTFILAGDGYRVSIVISADEALHALRRERYDLVVLGTSLDESSGIELLRTMRALPATHSFETRTRTVGVVTIADGGANDLEARRYAAFMNGADDVIVHPFDTRELRLRVNAVLRRALHVTLESDDVFTSGALFVDFAARHVTVDGQSVDLTRMEFALLRKLAENAGRLCTRARLFGTADGTRTARDRSVDACVLRLRRKLGAAADMIEKVRGEGYRLDRKRMMPKP